MSSVSRRGPEAGAAEGRGPLLRVLSDVAWRALVVAAGVVALVYLLARLRLVVLPVFVATLLAIVLAPPVTRLQRFGWPRLAATWTVFLGFAALVALAGLLVFPAAVDEFAGLDEAVSAGVDDVEQWLIDGPLGLSSAELRRYRADAGEAIRGFLGGTSGLLSGAVLVVEAVAGAILSLVVTFFVLKDGPQLRAWTLDHLPQRHHDTTIAAARSARSALAAYLRGAAVIGALEGVIIGVTLAIVGAPLAMPVAMLTFLGGFFPIVGALVAGVIAVLVALVGGGTTDAIVVGAVSLVVQQVDNDVLAPLIYGRIIRLHPLVVILSITAGGSLAGITGAFLAVPTAAVVAAVAGELWERRDATNVAGEGESAEMAGEASP